MRRKLSRWLVVLAVPVVFTSCQLIPEEEVLPEIPVIRSYEVKEYEQIMVKRGDLELAKNVSCTYVAAKEENHSFSVGGQYVDKLYVNVGDHVETGDLLADLEQESLQVELKEQEYDLKRLQLQREHFVENMALDLLPYDIVLKDLEWELERTEGYRYERLLVDKEKQEELREKQKVTYAEPLQDIEDAIYIQELVIQETRDKIKERQLYATISGTVTYTRTVNDKTMIQKGQNMVTISDLDTNVFVIKGNDAQYFEVDEEVTITCFQQEYTAKVVDASELGLDKQSENEAMIYLRLQQPDLSLENGVTGRIQLVLERKEDVLYIDKNVVKTANGEKFVYVMGENGLRTMQTVVTGFENDKYVEIIDGLSEGDMVIIS